MTHAAHTPGPWRLVTGTPCPAIEAGRFTRIANVALGETGAAEGAANARLMVAAPDMLAALELARAMLGNRSIHSPEDQASIDQMDAAIAQAKGL